MKRKYWINNNRVIIPLPAPLKEQLEDQGVEFENNGTVDYKLVGKKVLIDFKQKEEGENND